MPASPVYDHAEYGWLGENQWKPYPNGGFIIGLATKKKRTKLLIIATDLLSQKADDWWKSWYTGKWGEYDESLFCMLWHLQPISHFMPCLNIPCPSQEQHNKNTEEKINCHSSSTQSYSKPSALTFKRNLFKIIASTILGWNGGLTHTDNSTKHQQNPGHIHT